MLEGNNAEGARVGRSMTSYVILDPGVGIKQELLKKSL